jgi:hypothetical protein
MADHRIDLKQPGLIGEVYAAIMGQNPTDHPVKRKVDTFLVQCFAKNHPDNDPSCWLFMDTNRYFCWSHPSFPKKGGIFDMIREARVAEGFPGKNDAARALAFIEKEVLRLDKSALRPQPPANPRYTGTGLQKSKVAAVFKYFELDGSLNSQILRLSGLNERGEPDKDFRFRRPDGNGRWIYHRAAWCERPSCPCRAEDAGPLAHYEPPFIPYLYPELRAGIAAERTIILPEGEQKARTLTSLDFVATAYPDGGSFELPPTFVEHFAGAKRLLIPADADTTGRACAARRAAQFSAFTEAVALDLFPDRTDGYDTDDFIMALRKTGANRRAQRAAVEKLFTDAYRATR